MEAETGAAKLRRLASERRADGAVPVPPFSTTHSPVLVPPFSADYSAVGGSASVTSIRRGEEGSASGGVTVSATAATAVTPR